MEIAGYPHYENVCSNILAFFLEPGRPHGPGTLFLDAIAQIGAIQNQGEAIDSNISVDREARTDAGNQIDILVQSDSHVILIENKIFAGVDNPFCDYAAYAEALEPAGRHINKFLLTLKPNNAGADHGFRNVTHGHLIHKIRELLGHYIGGANTRYLTFMLDFLNTLDNLQEGMVMNAHIDIPPEKVAAFCKRWQIAELALFGSVLRDDFGPESDVDVLVRFDPQAQHTLVDLAQIEDQLGATLGRKVDLIEREAVERSQNYIRRKAILQSAETIYAA